MCIKSKKILMIFPKGKGACVAIMLLFGIDLKSERSLFGEPSGFKHLCFSTCNIVFYIDTKYVAKIEIASFHCSMYGFHTNALSICVDIALSTYASLIG